MTSPVTPNIGPDTEDTLYGDEFFYFKAGSQNGTLGGVSMVGCVVGRFSLV